MFYMYVHMSTEVIDFYAKISIKIWNRSLPCVYEHYQYLQNKHWDGISISNIDTTTLESLIILRKSMQNI